MATKVYIPEQETFEIGDNKFTVIAWPTMFGLEIQSRVQDELTSSGRLSPSLMKDMVVNRTSVNSVAITEKKFDEVFSRKYVDLMELVQKIMAFNFGETEEAEKDTAGPKEESDTSE